MINYVNLNAYLLGIDRRKFNRLKDCDCVIRSNFYRRYYEDCDAEDLYWILQDMDEEGDKIVVDFNKPGMFPTGVDFNKRTLIVQRTGGVLRATWVKRR